MNILSLPTALLALQLLSGAWALGVTDCSGPSSSILTLQRSNEQLNGWHTGDTVEVEGRVRNIAAPHALKVFMIQGTEEEEGEVLVVAPADVDMAPHEGERVRVRGTLDTSTSTGATLLLLPPGEALEEAMLLCHSPVHGSRRLHEYFNRAYFDKFQPRYMLAGTFGGCHYTNTGKCAPAPPQ